MAVSASRAWDRVLWSGTAISILGVGMIARAITPDARGFGTHTQLGLPACGFQLLTGLPCPACGMTTCFAHMVRGELVAAAHCHPVGALLFVALCVLVPLSMWASVSKRPFFETLTQMHVARIARVSASVLLLQWSVRVARLLLA